MTEVPDSVVRRESAAASARTTRALLVIGAAIALAGWIGGHISDPTTWSGAAVLMGGITLLASAAVAFLEGRRREVPWGEVLRAVVAPVFDSTRAATWFGVGVFVGLPIIRFRGTVITDADSTRLLANVQYVRNHGVGYLRETQEVLVPHAAYWFTSAIGGVSLARWVPLVSYLLLSGTVAHITFRITRRPLATITAAVALFGFAPLLRQEKLLPLYALMLAVSYLGAEVAERVAHATERRAQWRLAALSALLLVLSAESHATGQLLFVAPALLVALGPWRVRLRAAARVYAVAAVLMLPRLAINVSVRGTSRLRSNYDYYLIRKGYLNLINERFWGYPVNVPLTRYVRDFARMLVEQFRFYAIPVLVLAIIGFVVIPRGAKALALLASTVLVVGILALQPSPFPRYALPLAPGLAILAGIGLASLASRFPPRGHLPIGLPGGFGAAALVLSALWALVNTAQFVNFTDNRVLGGPWPTIVARIDDGRPVAGVRSPQMMYLRDDLEVFGPVYWSEDEYVTYLTWPSDDAVLEIMSKYGIGWVFVTGDTLRTDKNYEVDYPASWLEPTHGQRPRHPEMLAASPEFCRVLRFRSRDAPAGRPTFYELYRVGSCAPGEEV